MGLQVRLRKRSFHGVQRCSLPGSLLFQTRLDLFDQPIPNRKLQSLILRCIAVGNHMEAKEIFIA
ncbi:MAG: hypothetical protein IJO79_05975 [Firmicutes bacterium]|nr:hypothetical protein [Bacillota bacterium]